MSDERARELLRERDDETRTGEFVAIEREGREEFWARADALQCKTQQVMFG
jgi:hypothetical protein